MAAKSSSPSSAGAKSGATAPPANGCWNLGGQAPVKKMPVWKKPFGVFSLVVIGLLLFWLMFSAIGNGVETLEPEKNDLRMTSGGNATLPQAFVVHKWQPENILREDSMILDRVFRPIRVPQWIMDKTLKGERGTDWYGQALEFQHTNGRIELVGAGQTAKTIPVRWDEMNRMMVRVAVSSPDSVGVLYYTLRSQKLALRQ